MHIRSVSQTFQRQRGQAWRIKGKSLIPFSSPLEGLSILRVPNVFERDATTRE